MHTRSLAVALALLIGCLTLAYADGNPRPGYPHDTIMIHVQKGDNGPKQCDGGHSLFLRHIGGVVQPALIKITMVDWNQLNNDGDTLNGDALYDEDPLDGIDNDLDGLVDEDPVEPGAVTTALDCDALDGEAALQIRDVDPRPGVVSTQEWFIRLVGRPQQNFAFTSYAQQVVSCSVTGPDGVPDTGDECTTEWVMLASFNLALEGCVKQVKLGGPGVKAGGKTPFCDITDGFEVDIDTNGDGVPEPDLMDQFVFATSCLDNLETLDVDESLLCPLNSIVWDIDEENTTSRATAQIFVAHTGSADIKRGRIVQ